MQHDKFLTYLYTLSSLSNTTQNIYMRWVTRCCQYHHVTHCLDVSPEQLDAFRLWLLQERHYAPSSDTIVYNAFRHTYTVLLPQVDKNAAELFLPYFQTPPRQPYKLPRYVDQETMRCFLQALPKTVAGNLIRHIYSTSKPFDIVAHGWKCNKNYVQGVCAKTARAVGIPHGFGLSGVRGAGILHRIQNRQNDLELKMILDDSGLSPVQFARYVQAAGGHVCEKS